MTSARRAGRSEEHAFAEVMLLGRLILVPMSTEDGVFSGRVATHDAPTRRVRSTIERGPEARGRAA